MSSIKPTSMALIALSVVSGLVVFQLPDQARAEEVSTPARLITMAAEFPGLEISTDEDLEMDLIFHNKGRSDETVKVWVADQPAGWKARIKTYRFNVTGIHVPSGTDKTLTFEAKPSDDMQPGTYTFRLEAQTPDEQFKMAESITVHVKAVPQEQPAASEEIALSTTYPVLRGPTDGTFEFSVEVDSDLDTDAVFDLFAEGPPDWTINFKPAYESKYISSLQIQANQSRNVAIEVKPPVTAQAGEYPIKVRTSAGRAKAEIDLQVILTGTYKLEAGTPSGLLSLEARRGQPANMSIYVKNTGSAVNHDIRFLSFKPENWQVEFTPESIEALAPGGGKSLAFWVPTEPGKPPPC